MRIYDQRCVEDFLSRESIFSYAIAFRIFRASPPLGVFAMLLPEINSLNLDIFTVGDYKLCCYVNCLVLGVPTYKNSNLCFAADSYLKISEHHFLRYFNFFDTTLQLTEQFKPEGKNIETALIAQSDLVNNCVTYIFTENEQNQAKIVINCKFTVKVTFSFDFEELYRFFVGFRNLCFKVYCYPIFVEEFLFYALRKTDITFFQKKLDEFLVLPFSYSSQQILEDKDYFYLHTILARHQTLLCKIKCSFDCLPDEVDI